MKYVFECKYPTAHCVGRQSCFAKAIGVPEYCAGTLKEATGLKLFVLRWGTVAVDRFYQWKDKHRHEGD